MTISNSITTELEGAVSKGGSKAGGVGLWFGQISLDPDGFSFGFYRKFWTCIENDVFAAVNYFFTFGDIPKGCNACFIALIPKVHDANLVKDFRPISLIGSIYKIIAKILANRPFILNVVIHWCKSKESNPYSLQEVDFEKAYDSVRWDFLDDVLKKFGFGNKWCDWIQKCLRSSRGSIIINGSPTEEFQFFKGLKQGDPLSPFLFILIMESLHLSFQSVVDVGLFKGIHLSPLVNLSHMFYADDAVFVGQWCDDNINTLVHVLECFLSRFGLVSNMSKSKIMGVNVEMIRSKYKKWRQHVPCTSLVRKLLDKGKLALSNWELKVPFIGGWIYFNLIGLRTKKKVALEFQALFALNRAVLMNGSGDFYSHNDSYGLECDNLYEALMSPALDNNFVAALARGMEQSLFKAAYGLCSFRSCLIRDPDRWFCL
ncbi:RNA-directed DNA polymerase, eukaryota [Tanacetum coccineum]|uniref:RNA-directed DNA polymerase, eukaryota n=1 Tax=Tanacetum coccineum TaxID=301880 RepID=A0ABQ5CPD0_9ASTR